MRMLAAGMLTFAFAEPVFAQQNDGGNTPIMSASSLSVADVQAVSPALARYAREDILGSLWERPQLSRRDRSIVTLSVMIARNQTVDLAHYLGVGLDAGLKPSEISELITHLAFYAGWANAMSAIRVTKEVFAQREIGADQLPAASPELLPLNQASEDRRATSVQGSVGAVSPGLVQYTTDPLFLDLWLRPDLAPRDRSLVTLSSLIANGQSAQVTPHLNRAMDNGLTREEAGEVISHIAFYAGWPTAFSAAAVAADVFKNRPG